MFAILSSLLLSSSSSIVNGLEHVVGESEGWYTMTVNGKEYEYELIDGKRVYEGDIILPNINEGDNSDLRRRLNPSANEFGSLWPNGYIPYTIGDDGVDLDRLTDAMIHYHTFTNIRFGSRVDEVDYVEFIDGNGCWSYFGRQGGKQQISLENSGDWFNGYTYCSVGATIHEIGHALGMYHTQSREDRDQYVTINWGNILSGQEGQFVQHNWNADDCLRYDYGSLMHYGPEHLSNGNGATITAINPAGSAFGQRYGLSILDRSCINSLYSSCMVSLYEDDNYEGSEYSPFGKDVYDLNELINLDFEDNKVSSMKVRVHPNTKCVVELMDNANPASQGWSGGAIIEADNSLNSQVHYFYFKFSDLQTKGFKDNELSSMIVREDECWQQVAGSSGFKQISVSYDNQVWGVNNIGNSYRYNNDGPINGLYWTQFPGLLSQIDVGSWAWVMGVNSGGDVFHFDFVNYQWVQRPGNMKQVAISADVTVYAVNSNDEVFYGWDDPTWIPFNGVLSQIDVGSVNLIYGVNSYGTAFRVDWSIGWVALPNPYAGSKIIHISVAYDGTVMAVDSNNIIWKYIANDDNWLRIPGSLSQISVGSKDIVWGVRPDGSVWRFDNTKCPYNL